MAPRRRGDKDDGQPLLKDVDEEGAGAASLLRLSSRALSRASGSSRLKHGPLSRRSVYELENRESDVAFTIVVKRDGETGEESQEFGEAAVDIAQDVVNEAVQDAVQDVRRRDAGHLFACGQAVQDAVQEAVQDAIQQALEENVKFDVRANVFTLIAITGVILYWRGVWSLWDKLFGFSIWSELGSIGVGLIIMITFRLANVALLDGLPSG